MGLTVNFHFDYDDEKIRISRERGKKAKVTITPKARQNVAVRIPSWTPQESVQLSVNGRPVDPIRVGRFACVPRDLLPATIVLLYDLPVRRTVERIAGVDYSLTWRGDEIVSLTPNSDFMPLYPATME